MFTPVCLIITINYVIFFVVIWSVGHRGAISQSPQNSRRFQNCLTAIAIMTLLGLTWIFGALAFGKTRLLFEYLFCIFNSLQGLAIFVFHCVRIKDVRYHWKTFVSHRSLSYARSRTISSQRYWSHRSVEKKAPKSDYVKTNETKKKELHMFANPAYEKGVFKAL